MGTHNTYPPMPRSIGYYHPTYAYVAAGGDGLAIIDMERPEAPKVYAMYNAGGALDDARDVVVASTNASLFAYVADGKNGLKVLQLTSPDGPPRFYGFSPEPHPELIATYPTWSRAPPWPCPRAWTGTAPWTRPATRWPSSAASARVRSISKEMHELYLDTQGKPWSVTDEIERDQFRRGPEDSLQQVRAPSILRRFVAPSPRTWM